MTYYITARVAPAVDPRLHKRPDCFKLAKIHEIKSVELTPQEAGKRKKCRYCFPSEGVESEG